MKKRIMTMVLTAGLLVCCNSTANAGFMDTLNSVSNTLDTVNSTVDRTQRTYDRFKNTTTQTGSTTNYNYTTTAGSNMSTNGTMEHLKGTSYSKMYQNGKYGIYSDYDNDLVSEVKYDSIELIGKNGGIKVKIGNKYAIYDTLHNRELGGFEFDDVQAFDGDSNYVKVCKNSKWAIYYLWENKVISDYKYDDIKKLRYSYLYKVSSNNKYGIFSTDKDIHTKEPKGEIVPLQFADVDLCGANYFKVSNGTKWAVYDAYKKSVVSDYDYDEIRLSATASGGINGLKNGQWTAINLLIKR